LGNKAIEIMTTTNLVNVSNVNYLKCHINNMVEYFNNIDSMYLAIEKAMQHFVYENEQIETIVFAYILEWNKEKLNNQNKNYNN
jgi:hypothetical protein